CAREGTSVAPTRPRSSSYVGSAVNHEGSDPRVTIAPREVPAMLTADENAQLTRVGPGTLMGDLMRQYWIPVILSSELPAGGRVYMGPASPPPGLPDLEWTEVPEDQRFVSKFWQDCNYLQALEGGVDPAHISFLHGILDARDDGLRRALDQAAAGFGFAAQL